MRIFSMSVLSSIGFIAQSFIARAAAVCRVNGEVVPCGELGDAVKGFAAVAFIIPLIFAVVGILLFIFWIMMLVHAAKHPIENKPLWIIIILLGNGVGAIIYYFVVKRHFVSMPITVAPQPPSGPVTPPPAGE